MSEERAAPLCTDCKNYRDCGALVVVHGCGWEGLTDPVDGKDLYRRCHHMRSVQGACGPEGRLWSPRYEKA